MDKKVFLIIVLAAVVAIVLAYFIAGTKKDFKNQSIVKDNVILEEVKEDPQQVLDMELNKVENSQVEVKKVVKQPLSIQPPVVKPINVEEELVKTKLEASIEEETIDYGIYKEEGSNNIVITRNFNAKSPTKYSFKGFGFIDKVIE